MSQYSNCLNCRNNSQNEQKSKKARNKNDSHCHVITLLHRKRIVYCFVLVSFIIRKYMFRKPWTIMVLRKLNSLMMSPCNKDVIVSHEISLLYAINLEFLER